MIKCRLNSPSTERTDGHPLQDDCEATFWYWPLGQLGQLDDAASAFKRAKGDERTHTSKMTTYLKNEQ
jgi:hypothetical protein